MAPVPLPLFPPVAAEAALSVLVTHTAPPPRFRPRPSPARCDGPSSVLLTLSCTPSTSHFRLLLPSLYSLCQSPHETTLTLRSFIIIPAAAPCHTPTSSPASTKQPSLITIHLLVPVLVPLTTAACHIPCSTSTVRTAVLTYALTLPTCPFSACHARVIPRRKFFGCFLFGVSPLKRVPVACSESRCSLLSFMHIATVSYRSV